MSEVVYVECYSGHTYAQEPHALIARGERRVVTAVERSWQTPDGPRFLVRTEDGGEYLLEYDVASDRWLATEKRKSKT